MRPYGFSHKVARGVDVGNLVCASGASFVRFALGRALDCKKVNSGVQIPLEWLLHAHVSPNSVATLKGFLR